MADELVGSARIRIEPDFTGFDTALLSELETAVSEANGLIINAFTQAANTSASALASIGTDDTFTSITQSAETAGSDAAATIASSVEQMNASLSSIISPEVTISTTEAETEVRALNDRLAGLTADEQVIVLNAATREAEAGIRALEAQLRNPALTDVEIRLILDERGDAAAALEDIRGRLTDLSGDVDASTAEAGNAIAGNIASGAAGAAAGLAALEDEGQETANSLLDAFDGAARGIVVALATIGTVQVFRGFFADAERIASIGGITEQLIETTGAAANVTADEVNSLADSLEAVTGMESEVVAEGANVLLTFKGVRNEGEGLNAIFDRTVRAGADLSTVLGGDVRGSTLQLGKALQDPVRGMNLLRRAGVDFTEQQREQVKALVESNQKLEAQKVILGEVESQVGGAAAAAAKSSDLIVRQFEKIGEEIGAGLLQAGDALAEDLPALIEDVLPDARRFGEGLGEVLTALVDSFIELAPLLGTTGDLLSIVAPLFEVMADAVDAIPAPVLQAGAALLVANRALRLFTAARNLSAVSALGQGLANLVVPTTALPGALTGAARGSGGLLTGIRGLTKGTAGATLALTAGFFAVDKWNSIMSEARQEGIDFGNSVREQFDLTSMSAAELAGLSERLGTGITDLRDDIKGGLAGATIDRDFNESIKTGADELERFQEEVDAARDAILQANAEAEFGDLIASVTDTGEALTELRVIAPEVTSAIHSLRLGADDSESGFLNLATALDRAGLSEEDFAKAAALVGVSTEDLQGFIETTTGALNEFIETAVSGLPTVSTAFERALGDATESAERTAQAVRESADEQAQAVLDAADARIEAAGDALDDSGADLIREAAQERADAIREAGDVEAQAIADGARVTAAGLTDALTIQAEELADFRRDLEQLSSAGFADVAGLLAQQGQEAGDALADELATALETGNLEIIEGLRTANNSFREESQATIQFIQTELAPQFLSATGLLSSAISEAFGSNLDFDERIRIAAELARLELDARGEPIAAIAAVEGEAAARRYGEAFKIDQEIIDKAVAAGLAIKENNPTDEYHAAGAAGGVAYGQGIIDGMTLLQSQIDDKAQQLVLSARAAAARTAKESSPSKLFMTLGENMALGVVEGLNDAEAAVVRAAEDIVNAAAAAAARTTITPSVTTDDVDFAAVVQPALVGAPVGTTTTASSTVNQLITQLGVHGSSAPLIGELNIYETTSAEDTARQVEGRLRRIQSDLTRKD